MTAEQIALPTMDGPALVVGPSPLNKRKASDAQLVEVYRKTKSLKKTATQFGMCAQSVHERITRLGENRHVNIFTNEDKETLLNVYDWHAAGGLAKELAADMGRTPQFLSRQARKLGLTKYTRKREYLAGITSVNMREWLKHNPHPRGMLGKTHSDENKNQQSNRSFVRWHSMDKQQQIAFSQNSRRNWRAGWREIGGQRIYCRSRWEANYARYLEWLRRMKNIAKWEHEPKVFWFLEIKRGTRSYLPDFRITETDGSIAYHEVKGWMDPQSKTKIKRMAKYHPEEKLIVVGSKSYRALEKMVSRMIVGWERSR